MLRWRLARPLSVPSEIRTMNDVVILRHLENLDRRLANVEQILPTLATKDELRTLATKDELREAVALLATKEDLRAAIAPLATRDELRAESARLRGHMDVIGEALHADIRLLAEQLASVIPRRSGS
jgi:uncharacterized protein YicC (UPF0701 family)